jgi:predicted metal-dependent hydrolase
LLQPSNLATPAYTIRRSANAKNIRLKVTPKEGLIAVIPHDYDEAKLPSILKRKKDWISNALAKAQQTRRFLESQPITYLPEQLDLRALGQQRRIEYRECISRSGLSLRTVESALVFSGGEFPRKTVIAKLRQWLQSCVREELAPLASGIAAQKGFKLNRVLIKNQRTRWASCSARRNLSLNTKLLFLSPELVRYVLVHELCHTIYMNHSNEFWRLVETHEPRFRSLDRQLRDAWKTLPQWLF